MTAGYLPNKIWVWIETIYPANTKGMNLLTQAMERLLVSWLTIKFTGDITKVYIYIYTPIHYRL